MPALVIARNRVSHYAILVLVLFILPSTINLAIADPPDPDELIVRQVAEGLELAEHLKVYVTSAYQITGLPPGDRSDAGLSPRADNTQGRYVANVDITDGVIHVTFGNEADPEIAGTLLTLTPYENIDMGITWRCAYATAPTKSFMMGTQWGAPIAYVLSTVPEQYLPANCRS